MIRTAILNEVKEFLEDNNYDVSFDETLSEFEEISFTPEEEYEIECMFDEELERRYQEEAELERELESLMLEWEAETRELERYWRSERGVA